MTAYSSSALQPNHGKCKMSAAPSLFKSPLGDVSAQELQLVKPTNSGHCLGRREP
eukprot:CAMPEP_0185450866 /NCGR_PEP_ID=MMETSP1365-20130426/63838_1 /TAXON_ID=38817 /ORGANISM="Gephyrocapsa oceanica, Strain RCC1303" /LENGTH=54 /DNA_ID=CAMNT_0028056987 /DNA_START=56 /DNA_END=217 /DNA_ORIENTATION=+